MYPALKRMLNLVPTPAVYADEHGRLPPRARINLLIKFCILTPLVILGILSPALVLLVAVALLVLSIPLNYTRKRTRARRRAANHCENCNYDRRGLLDAALCPECGAPRLT